MPLHELVMPQPCFHFDLHWGGGGGGGGGGGLERDWIPHCEVELTCEKRKKRWRFASENKMLRVQPSGG